MNSSAKFAKERATQKKSTTTSSFLISFGINLLRTWTHTTVVEAGSPEDNVRSISLVLSAFLPFVSSQGNCLAAEDPGRSLPGCMAPAFH